MNEYYEWTMPADHKPTPSSKQREITSFVQNKYIKKIWVNEDAEDPVKLYKSGEFNKKKRIKVLEKEDQFDLIEFKDDDTNLDHWNKSYDEEHGKNFKILSQKDESVNNKVKLESELTKEINAANSQKNSSTLFYDNCLAHTLQNNAYCESTKLTTNISTSNIFNQDSTYKDSEKDISYFIESQSNGVQLTSFNLFQKESNKCLDVLPQVDKEHVNDRLNITKQYDSNLEVNPKISNDSNKIAYDKKKIFSFDQYKFGPNRVKILTSKSSKYNYSQHTKPELNVKINFFSDLAIFSGINEVITDK